MILECPRCTTRFRVPEDAVGARGRLVQCGSCNLEWTAHTDDLLQESGAIDLSVTDDPAISEALAASGWDPSAIGANQQQQAAQPDSEAAAALDALDTLALRRPPGVNPSVGWFGLSGFVALLLAIFTLFRVPIVEGFPPVNKIYEAIGAPVVLVGRGLEIRPPSAQALVGPSDRILTVSGIIRNRTQNSRPVPSLMASLRDANGNPVYSWAFYPSDRIAGPANSVRYKTSVRNPPSGASGIFITFITDEEIEDDEVFVDIGEDPFSLPDASGGS